MQADKPILFIAIGGGVLVLVVVVVLLTIRHSDRVPLGFFEMLCQIRSQEAHTKNITWGKQDFGEFGIVSNCSRNLVKCGA